MIVCAFLEYVLDGAVKHVVADTDKMDCRVATMIVDVVYGKRPGPIVMTGRDMSSVEKAAVVGCAPTLSQQSVRIVQHSA